MGNAGKLQGGTNKRTTRGVADGTGEEGVCGGQKTGLNSAKAGKKAMYFTTRVRTLHITCHAEKRGREKDSVCNIC